MRRRTQPAPGRALEAPDEAPPLCSSPLRARTAAARRVPRSHLATLAAVGAAALGCSGIWREAVSASFSEMTVDLEIAVPATDPNRPRIQALIDDGWIAAWQGEVGLWDSVGFTVALDEATADGAIHDGEVVLLSERAAAFRENLPDPGRRAELLLIKAMMDERERLERHLPADGADAGATGAAVDPSGWTLPGDLEQAVTRAGWHVASCVDRADPGVTWARCEGDSGELHATAIVERYDQDGAGEAPAAGPGVERVGNTSVEVRVVDGAAAAALRDALGQGRSSLGDVTEAELRDGLGRSGWRVVDCEADDGPVERSTTCNAVRDTGSDRASVTVVRVPGSGGVAQRSLSAGVATLTAGANVLSVTVHDEARTDALLDVLLGR